MLSVPVLLLIFNRPNETKKVFDQIKRIKPRQLFIAADGPRNREEEKLCLDTRAITSEIDWECKLYTLFQKENLGCKQAVTKAVSWFFEHVEQGIILEDDCIPNKDFFDYSTTLLNKYRNDTRFFSISGSNLVDHKDPGSDYFFMRVASSWGWATWRRVWIQYLNFDLNNVSVEDAKKLVNNFFHDANACKLYLPFFETAREGRIDSWAVPFAFFIFFNNGLNIFPRMNLISNIGVEGTHYNGSTSILNKKSQCLSLNVQPQYIVPHHEMEREYFKQVYNSFNQESYFHFISQYISKLKGLLKSQR